MIVTFDTPAKIISFRDKDKITIETSESTILQIVDSLADKKIAVRSTNLPDVIAVEGDDYDRQEYSREEVAQKFKEVVSILSERNRAVDQVMNQAAAPDAEASSTPTPTGSSKSSKKSKKSTPERDNTTTS